MEIASDETITEAEKERTRSAISKLCQDACEEFSAEESKKTARAVFHDAVSAAAKEVAEQIASEAAPIASEIVAGMLRNPDQHPFVKEAVLAEACPAARQEALAAVRRWSEEKALPNAEAAVKSIFLAKISDGYITNLQTSVLAGMRVVLENQVSDKNQQLSQAEREKLFDEYLSGDARRTAKEYISAGLTAAMRREAQSAAEHSIEEIAIKATDAVARETALETARSVAAATAKSEISRLILAEAQRRAAKLARERLQEEAQRIEEDKRLEYCQEEAKKIADEAIVSVTEEIADPSVAELDLEKAKELALSAASAVAREFSGVYQLTDDSCATISKKTIAFLVVQIVLGCFIVWFFLLGGYETCQPLLKTILPPSLYQAIYKSVPPIPTNPGDASNTDIDDLLEEQNEAGGQSKGEEDASDSTAPLSRGAETDGKAAVPEEAVSPAEAVKETAPSQDKLDKNLQDLPKENEMPPDVQSEKH